MYYSPENVDPGTVEKIRQARSLSGLRGEPPMTPFRNIGQLLFQRAAESPQKPFLLFFDDGELQDYYTYERFYLDVRRLAAFLSVDLGIRAGDRVATITVNDARTVLVYFAAWLIGGTVVPVNCAEDVERVAYILENSAARAIFLHADQVKRCRALAERLPQIRSLVQIGGESPRGITPFQKALQAREPLGEIPDLPPDSECLIVYTSGTTGAPKGVVLEQYNLLADAHSIAEWHRFTPNDRAMCVLPIHHVNGTVVTLVTPLYSGGSVALNRRFSAQHASEIIIPLRAASGGRSARK